MIKLLQTGHALASIVELKKLGLHRGIFPVLDVALDEAERHDGREKFVRLALADTDAASAKASRWRRASCWLRCCGTTCATAGQQRQAAGEPPFPALQEAIDDVFDARIGDISGRGKLAADMREIWMMQPRFERRAGSSAPALVEQPRFRAGFDFLRLRAEVGEVDAELADWWEALFQASDEQRRDILDGVREQRGPRRVKRAPAPGASETARRRRRSNRAATTARARHLRATLHRASAGAAVASRERRAARRLDFGDGGAPARGRAGRCLHRPRLQSRRPDRRAATARSTRSRRCRRRR